MKKFLSNLRKTFKFAFKSDKSAIFIVIALGLIKGISLFLPLIFSEQIVNSIYSSSDTLEFIDIFVIALIFIIFIFVTTLLSQLLTSYFNGLNDYLYGSSDLLLAKRSFTLDYEILEKNDNKMLLQKARDGANSSGGVGYFLSNIADLIQNVFVFILGFTYILKLFTFIENLKPGENDNTFLFNFANSIYCGVTIIVIFIISLILTIFLLTRIYKISVKMFEDNIDYNRKYNYFFRVFSDYHLAKDVRIFSLSNLILE